ncbi:MAG TPA: phosphatidylinositol mannoside acyltransferase [Sporichthyaceae bacterium]
MTVDVRPLPAAPTAATASLLERAVAPAYLLGWRTVRRMPEPLADRMFARIADTLWARRGRGVVQLERNLARVLDRPVDDPTVRARSRDSMRSYLRYWAESFRLPAWDAEQVLDRVHPEGEEHLDGEHKVGVGVVLALPHCANWDLAGAWLAARGMPFTTAAERLRPAALYDAFVSYRTGLGMEVLPLERGNGISVFGALSARLRDGRVVCLVADRDLTESGIEVDFFGAPARMPAGPAALSVGTGAALLPVTLWYEGRAMRLRIHPRIPQPTRGTRSERIAAMTGELAGVFQNSIAAHPADWHMLQRIWAEDLRLRHPSASR